MELYLKSDVENTKYYGLTYSGGSDATELKGTTSSATDIYISVGVDSNPTQFNYDLVLTDLVGDFSLFASAFPQFLGDPSGYAIQAVVKPLAGAESSVNTLKITFAY